MERLRINSVNHMLVYRHSCTNGSSQMGSDRMGGCKSLEEMEGIDHERYN